MVGLGVAWPVATIVRQYVVLIRWRDQRGLGGSADTIESVCDDEDRGGERILMIRQSLMIVLMLVAAPLATRAGNSVREIHYAASDKAGELDAEVYYYLWIPDKVERIRGVLVHQHGCGTGAEMGGVTAAQDLHWQALARKWDLALMGSSYRVGDGGNCRRWCDPRNGSEQTFLRALEDFGKETGHPELTRVPWCLWGHSGGAFWSSLMQTRHADRIVAIWFRSGTALGAWEKGEVSRPELGDEVFKVPAMGNPGVKEREDPRFRSAWENLSAMHGAYRARGAPFGLAPDPRTGHECGDSRYLAIPFFDACLRQRLPEPGGDPAALKPIDFSVAWLAEPGSAEAVAAADYKGDPAKAVWLPDEAFARKWSEYVRVGSVSDETPPKAPVEVRASRLAGGGVGLTWEVEADLESGVGGFVIERDGKEIARLPERAVGRFGRPLFQGLTYHDTPESPVPGLVYEDKGAREGSLPVYRVKVVNSVGLSSEPSAPASADHRD